MHCGFLLTNLTFPSCYASGFDLSPVQCCLTRGVCVTHDVENDRAGIAQISVLSVACICCLAIQQCRRQSCRNVFVFLQLNTATTTAKQQQQRHFTTNNNNININRCENFAGSKFGLYHMKQQHIKEQPQQQQQPNNDSKNQTTTATATATTATPATTTITTTATTATTTAEL